ncbi:MAG TPA: TatD family hydrolase [Acidimicrobiales bacterium]|jgi:TatD DNase family protein|nr:TatD family hydrolase [Acidimicrobiales bacterium]
MSGWTDAHCHLQDTIRSSTDEPHADVVDTLERAHAAGVNRVVVVGTDAVSSAEALAIADLTSTVDIYATVGLHPHDAKDDLDPVATLARKGHEKLVGIGECGLDYYYEHSPRTQQRQAFSTQIALAHELDLALVVHARDAFDDLFDIFKSEGVPPRTVIHCFTGSPDDAEACLALGCDISISGVVTFKNAESLREATRLVPLDRLHVETDSPFLAPVPFRGRTNEPAHVSVVGEFVAQLRDEDLELVRSATAANSARLFLLPGWTH